MNAPRPKPGDGATSRAIALEQRRKRGVQAIKAAQRELQLDDDTYRAMLHRLTGKHSATTLSLDEQSVVLDHLRASGAANPKRAGRDAGKRRPTTAAERQALLAKVNSLLDELGRLTGQPHTLAYADAICKRNGWAEAVDFCPPSLLHKLVGALATTMRARQAKAAKPQA
jgi:hypothetical protein